MAYSIEWTESAVASVADQVEYIAKDSPGYAATLVTKAEKAANSLNQFPRRGRVVPEYGDASLRELFVDRYRLIYRVDQDRILIVAFVHGARDLAALQPDIEQ